MSKKTSESSSSCNSSRNSKRVPKKQPEVSLKDRLKYRFDNRMAKGTGEMIKILAIFSILIALISAFLIFIFAYGGEDFGSSLWDSFSTIINAWMPYSDEGSAVYLITTAIVAIFGVLITSVLIGIISTAIEEKIDSLREGSSRVLEKGHVVLLGFTPGSYELINQLVLSAQNRKLVLVIGSNLAKSEIEDYINDNVEIPKNVKIICRKVDITDPVSIGLCSVENSSAIIVNGQTNSETVMSLLALFRITREYRSRKIPTIAQVSDSDYILPETLRKARNLTMIKSGEAIARIIAHSCLQPGISEAFTELFCFEGNEIYIKAFPELTGKTYKEICSLIVGATALGYKSIEARDNSPQEDLVLNPPSDAIYEEGYELIYLSEGEDHISFAKAISEIYCAKETVSAPIPCTPNACPAAGESCSANAIPTTGETRSADSCNVAILGYKKSLTTIIDELPATIGSFLFVGCPEEAQEEILAAVKAKNEDTLVLFKNINLMSSLAIEEEMKDIAHVVILSSEDEEDTNEADLKSMMLLLKLRDIKLRTKMEFSITTEMYYEKNRRLVSAKDTSDFVVASNVSAMMLAQLASNPELYRIFKELLSKNGARLSLKLASMVINQESLNQENKNQESALTFRTLNSKCLSLGLTLVGHLPMSAPAIILNPSQDETVSLSVEDKLIVIE